MIDVTGEQIAMAAHEAVRRFSIISGNEDPGPWSALTGTQQRNYMLAVGNVLSGVIKTSLHPQLALHGAPHESTKDRIFLDVVQTFEWAMWAINPKDKVPA